MGKCLAICLVMTLAGCVSVPKSVDEIKAAGKAKHSFCSGKSHQETVAIIEQQLNRCFAHGVQEIVGGTSNTFIEKLDTGKNTVTLASVVHANWNRFYQMRVDISALSTCPSFVEAYGMSDSWSDTTKLIQSWVDGESIDKC